MNKFPTTPQTISQCWKTGFNIYKNTFAKIWYLMIIITLSNLGIQKMLHVILNKYFWQNGSYLLIIFNLISSVVLFSVIVYFSSLVLYRVYQLSMVNNNSLRDSLGLVWSKYRSLFLGCVYCLLLLSISFIVTISISYLLILTPLNVSVRQILIAVMYVINFFFVAFLFFRIGLFFIPFILFDDCTAWLAIKKGWELSKGHVWRILLVIFSPTILLVVVYAIAILIFGLCGFGFTSGIIALAIIVVIMLMILTFFIAPWQYALLLTQFSELKIREKILYSKETVKE